MNFDWQLSLNRVPSITIIGPHPNRRFSFA
jgi:hypothetical protein